MLTATWTMLTNMGSRVFCMPTYHPVMAYNPKTAGAPHITIL